jgi:DNA-directed RNA polymerase specialized sigma subunit
MKDKYTMLEDIETLVKNQCIEDITSEIVATDDGMLLETEDLAEQLKELYEQSKTIDVLDFLEELAQTEIKVRGFKG